jgi:hypothetical protein
MTKAEKLATALEGSRQAAIRLIEMKSEVHPTAATSHMPFPGHRTMATVWAQQAAARKRERERVGHRGAMQFGFDPASLKASGR